MEELHVEITEQGRADAVLATSTGLSRNKIQQLTEDGFVTIAGVPIKSNRKVKPGEAVMIVMPEVKPAEVVPQNIKIDIVYEDGDLAVIDKPQGMVVHPSAGHEDGTLVNALLYHMKDLSSIGGIERPGIVHRIDRMTSGLLVIAKNDNAHQSLSEQFSEHTAHREYLTIAIGNFKEDSGTIDAPIGRSPSDRKKMAVVRNGKRAVTHWQVLERFGNFTLLKVQLETGRTHQIRVHLSSVNHPIAGDDVYGSGKNPFGLTGQALHGYKLRFVHPRTREKMCFFSPLPEYFRKALERLGTEVSLDRLYEENTVDNTNGFS